MLDDVVVVAAAVDLGVVLLAGAHEGAGRGVEARGLVVAVAVAELELGGSRRQLKVDIARAARQWAQRLHLVARRLSVDPHHPVVGLARRLDLLPEPHVLVVGAHFHERVAAADPVVEGYRECDAAGGGYEGAEEESGGLHGDERLVYSLVVLFGAVKVVKSEGMC